MGLTEDEISIFKSTVLPHLDAKDFYSKFKTFLNVFFGSSLDKLGRLGEISEHIQNILQAHHITKLNTAIDQYRVERRQKIITETEKQQLYQQMKAKAEKITIPDQGWLQREAEFVKSKVYQAYGTEGEKINQADDTEYRATTKTYTFPNDGHGIYTDLSYLVNRPLITMDTNDLNSTRKLFLRYVNTSLAGRIHITEDNSLISMEAKKFYEDNKGTKDAQLEPGTEDENPSENQQWCLFTTNMTECCSLCMAYYDGDKKYYSHIALAHITSGNWGEYGQSLIEFMIEGMENKSNIFGLYAINRQHSKTMDSAAYTVNDLCEILQEVGISSENQLTVYQSFAYPGANLSIGIDSLGNWGEVVDERTR